MAKKQHDDDYWRQRALKSENDMNKRVNRTEARVVQAYALAQTYLTGKITKLMKRMASRTDMSNDEVKRYLRQEANQADIKKLSVDIDSIKDDKVRERLKNDFTAQAFKSRINREYELLKSAEVTIQRLGEKVDNMLTDTYHAEISKAYADAAGELDEPNVKVAGDQTTKRILEKRWFGGNYSDRVWRDTDELAKSLEALLTVESLTGMSVHDMAKVLEKQFGVKKSEARRLLHTESNFIHNQARLQSWKDNGFKQYVLIAVHDSRTSVFCRHIDGKVFDVKDAKAEGMNGNFPPFHAWCRTVASAFFGDAPAGESYDPYTKETFKVPKGSTYDVEMMKRLDVDDADLARKMMANLHVDEINFDNYVDVLGEHSPKSLRDYQVLKYNDTSEYASLKQARRDIHYLQTTTKEFRNESDRPLAINTYWSFKRDGYDISAHAVARFSQRMYRKNGKLLYNYNTAMNVLKQSPNYKQGERQIRYYNKLAIVTEPNGRVVTVIRQSRAGKGWQEI